MPAANLLHHRALFHLSASPFPTYKMELVFITQNCKNCSQWLFLAVGLGCKAPVAEVTAGPGGHSNPQMAPEHICSTAQAFLHTSTATLPHQAQTRNVSHFVPSLRTNTSLQAWDKSLSTTSAHKVQVSPAEILGNGKEEEFSIPVSVPAKHSVTTEKKETSFLRNQPSVSLPGKQARNPSEAQAEGQQWASLESSTTRCKPKQQSIRGKACHKQLTPPVYRFWLNAGVVWVI